MTTARPLALAALFAAALVAAPSVHADPAEHDAAGGHHADVAKAPDFVGDPYPLSTDPVTGAALGEDSVAVVRDGRQLRFADAANVETFDADPAKYLKAVDAKIVADQTPLYPMTSCVVSGESLASMGKPLDVVVGNRLVRLCCAGCKSKLAADPAMYLADLDDAAVSAQSASYPLDACVVTGESLAEMGEPVETVVAGRLVMLCCQGCKDEVRENPAAAIAKVDAARLAKAGATTRPAMN